MLARGVRLLPTAAPAGRTFVKLPTAYTVLPMVVCAHTYPSLIWTVGRLSEVTTLESRWSRGAGEGSGSAAEAAVEVARMLPAATTTAVVSAARMRRPRRTDAL